MDDAMALRKRLLLLGGAAKAVDGRPANSSASDRVGMASASCGHTMSSPTSSCRVLPELQKNGEASKDQLRHLVTRNHFGQ
jgi:hypothetical protein